MLSSVRSDDVLGLSGPEARRRLAEHGPNELQAVPPVPRWRKVLAQFADPLVYLLLGAVLVSLVAWIVEGRQGWPVDVVVILVIVVLNGVLGYVQEARAEESVAALRRMAAPTAGVIRDGEQIRVPTEEIVVGDLLVLAEGDAVAADARLLSAATLTVSEASLTGESQPVLKDAATLPAPAPLAERLDMVFSGTAVTRGSAHAVVTGTGMSTEIGRVAELLARTQEDPTPLQREIARLGRMLGLAVVAIAVIVVGAVLLTNPVDSLDDVVTVLLLGVSLAVAAVPEGLPAVLSLVLAIGVRRLAGHQAVVTTLNSVETLGSASVICSDKTGTLTKSEMTVQRVVTASGECVVSGVGYVPDGRVEIDGVPLGAGPLHQEVVRVLSGGSLANDAVLREEHDATWSVQGDPTEIAFLVAEHKLGTAAQRERRFTRVGEIPFSSARKVMSTLAADAEHGGEIVLVSKGAPDVLLGRCTHLQVGDAVQPLDDELRRRVLGDVQRLSAAALRTLAVAYRRLPDSTGPPDGTAPTVSDELERDLVYAGMVGMIDPPRPEVAVAIGEAHRAGIRVVMITGDHPATAGRIAADLGIAAPDAPVLTGAQLDELHGDALTDAVRHTSVYARVAPQHKLDIVDLLQADGEIVAMTGDGVNDAPALKSADIGIAMGITGTEVTKQAARMILTDDNFATIVGAVRQGRAIFANIRKFLRYLLSSNVGEVLTVFLGVLFAGLLGITGTGEELVLPLLATQILWINLLTDSLPALAMGVDPQIDDVMARPPRKLDDRVIDARMWRGVAFIGAVMAVVTLLTLDGYLPGGLLAGDRSLDEARTAAFTVLVLAQLFNSLNARSETSSAFHRLFVNRWLWGALGLALVLQIAVVHLPVLNAAFGTTALDAGQWVFCTAMASVVLWAGEGYKLAGRVWRNR